jgi:hypothetical protein
MFSGMKEDSKSVVKSFVIILKDELQLQLQMQETKAKSEELLESIFLQDIVITRPKRKRSFIFCSNCFCFFVGAVKFSQFSIGLSSSEIKESLSVILTKFDSFCEKFDMQIKIKLI